MTGARDSMVAHVTAWLDLMHVTNKGRRNQHDSAWWSLIRRNPRGRM